MKSKGGRCCLSAGRLPVHARHDTLLRPSRSPLLSDRPSAQLAFFAIGHTGHGLALRLRTATCPICCPRAQQ